MNYKHLIFKNDGTWHYCPECKNFWIQNEKGDVKKGGWHPFTSDTKKIICPSCKEPDKYKTEIVRCFKCGKQFEQERGGKDNMYCEHCRKEVE